MKWTDLVEALFGTRHDIVAYGADGTCGAEGAGADFLCGNAFLDGHPIAIVGTTNHAPIGYALALVQARAILDTIARHPRRPILLLIDTQGQQLRRHDELLGINRAMAHLGCCIDLARRRGHCVLGLVYDQALSGGFITSGLMADACHALPEAEIRVMRLPAMARVTKLPEALLAELSLANPVFAPGVENYVAMGGVRSLWRGDLAAALREALGAPGELDAPGAGEATGTDDTRAQDGAERGGRRHAAVTIQRVLDAV
ncbi:MAG: biotin-independent malonate decarboxylase subunit gamma [Burkholderiales bacterium]|nr:biotin-independent malonate decarboxylase subunit gamma [Burkholderiales bacterium]